jgi:Ca2+/H+ antiporter
VVLDHDSSPGLARDTVFSAVMIVCNGLVGLCVLLGGLRHREQEFQTSGAGVYLSLLGALSVLTLVLPNYTLTIEGPYFSTAQLIFVSVITVLLYVTFLFVQTSRHVDYFRTPYEEGAADENAYPSNNGVTLSVIMLLVALGGVILIAEKFAVVMETGVEQIGAPQALVGIIIAMVVMAMIMLERGARFFARHHRADGAGGRHHQHRARQAAGARAFTARHVVAGADAVLERADVRNRTDQYPIRPHPSRRVRDIRVSDFRSVTAAADCARHGYV